MANVDAPSGLRYVGNIAAAMQSGLAVLYDVDSSNGTAIFKGDLVKLEADGNIAPAAAGDRALGVAVSVKPDYDVAATIHPGYLPASTAGKILVVTDPNALYEIQEDSVGAALAATDKGALVDIIAGAGSTTTGRSAHEVDSSTLGTSNGQLKLIKLVDRSDNAVGDQAKWVVKINEHYFSSEAGI